MLGRANLLALLLIAVAATSACTEGRTEADPGPSPTPPALTAAPSQLPLAAGRSDWTAAAVTLPLSGSDPGRPYLLDTRTGNVFELPFYGDWSPVGTILAGSMRGSPGLYMLDLATHILTAVHTGDAGFPVWSPDGTRVAAILGTGGLVIASRDGSVRTYPGPFQLGQLRWVDSERLAIRTDYGQSGAEGSYVSVDLRSGSATVVSPAVPAGSADPRVVFAAVDPTGRFAVFRDRGRLVGWTADTGGLVQLVEHEGDARWSPDGARVLISYWRAGEIGPLDAIFERGSWRRKDVQVGLYASWVSPSRILHLGFDCTPGGGSQGRRDVAVTDVETGGVVYLTHDDAETLEYEPVVSPGGDRVAFVALSPEPLRWSLRVLRTDSGEEEHVVTATIDLHLHGQAWSADGRYLRFYGPGGHGICT